ncbi:MAG: Uma2 family endonuclease [Chloroflexi bacterium]|nr:Uma2 family endonuclease [Chloroflexota bacterium]
MVIREHRYTREDLRALYDQPENAEKRFELLNGEIIEVPSASPIHNAIVAAIFYFLYGFVYRNQLGFVFGDSTTYVLPNGDELIPDVSFISKERQGWPLPKEFEFAPDLAVEVASPSNSERQLLEKAESFLESGTKIVWLVFADSRSVYVCRRNADGSLILRKVSGDGALAGEDVLPGFTLPLRDIFPPQEQG